ncbi:EamA family transporter [Aneurinibacillus migulanus]|nr:EamA family transporter [Aneurinibacillus migulanus]
MFSTEGISMLTVRGVFGALYLLAYFYTISKIPLADASILAHISPFFAIVFSVVFLTKAFTHENVVVEVTRHIGIVFNAI